MKINSKNLFDYDTMRAGPDISGADISYIDNGWLIGTGSNYGRMICDLSKYRCKTNMEYYIVYDIEIISNAAKDYFSAVVCFALGASIFGTQIVGTGMQGMKPGEKQRHVVLAKTSKAGLLTDFRIFVYNGHNSSVTVGNSFKITNLCLFVNDYTTKYIPYWWNVEKIMTRSKNLMGGVSFANSQTSTAGFYRFWGPLPNGTYTLSATLKDENNPSTRGLYLGYSTTGYNISGGAWVIKANAVATPNSRTFTATDSSPKYICMYGTKEEVFDDIELKYNVMLNAGSSAEPYVPYMTEVKKIAKGVKPECKLVLDGSETWKQYASGSWVGTLCAMSTNAEYLRTAQYNNWWGFQYFDNPDKYLWLQKTAVYIAWIPGAPPVSGWETADSDGKAIANIDRIKEDLKSKPLTVYYDNTGDKTIQALGELLKVVRREVYKAETDD